MHKLARRLVILTLMMMIFALGFTAVIDIDQRRPTRNAALQTAFCALDNTGACSDLL